MEGRVKQVSSGVEVNATFDYRKKSKFTILPDLVHVEDEEKKVSNQGVLDRDTQRKQSNKDYARNRGVREGDTVLLEKKKENKLSPSYEEPYEVTSCYGDQVLLRSPQGVQ